MSNVRVEIESKNMWFDITEELQTQGATYEGSIKQPPLPTITSSDNNTGIFPDSLIETGDTTTPHWYDLIHAIQQKLYSIQSSLDRAENETSKSAWQDQYDKLSSFFDGNVHGIRFTLEDGTYWKNDEDKNLRVLLETRYLSRNA